MRVIFLSLIVIGLCSCAPSSAPSVETIDEDASTLGLDVAAQSETPETPETPENPGTLVRPKTPELAEEDLGIVVVGRIAGDDGAATLKRPSGKVVTYRRGDEIMSGVTLIAIDRNFVRINFNGQEKKLPVSKGWTPGKTSRASGGFNAHQPSTVGLQVKADGTVIDSTGKLIGNVSATGEIIDPTGKVIGRVRK